MVLDWEYGRINGIVSNEKRINTTTIRKVMTICTGLSCSVQRKSCFMKLLYSL